MGKQQTRIPLYIAGFVALLGLILLIVGIVLIVRSNKASEGCSDNDASRGTEVSAQRCDTSGEAVRSGLESFLQKVQDTYFKLHPEDIIYKKGVKVKEIQTTFKPYDPTPENLKRNTDQAMGLLKEITDMKISMAKLKPREKKAVFQVKHFLKFNFAIPYDGNYYAGDFLMGPNQFCWQPICTMSSQLRYAIRYYRPKETKDLLIVRDKIAMFNQTFHQYIANIKYGVKAGMVRSVEECKAGLNAIKRNFFKIALNGPEGIFEESSVEAILHPKFLSLLENKTEDLKKWQTDYGKSVNETVRGYLLDYIGKPVDKLFRFLEFENFKYCVPSNISSGLGSLPVSYIYENGTNTGIETTKKLPTGETLNGKESYKLIMPFFTTNDMTPDQVHDLGFKMLHQLYPEVLEVARTITKEDQNSTAKEKFISRLNESDLFFVDDANPIPTNESNKDAHNLCSNLKNAQKYCPNRWAAMQRWFTESQKAMSMLDPKTVDMFYFNGYKHTAPNCPVQMRPNLNPSSGAQSYHRSNSNCTRPAYYNIPFFLDRPGPMYEEWSVNAHEARPGHHTQVQGSVEHFRDSCGGVISWLDQSTSYTAFTEGWALYAENPLIARDTDTYKDALFQKYGMLKWQVWRALRLIVDTGLHYKGFTREKALGFFADYAWDTTDGADKEVTRYQSDPGQATAYMIGQLHIIRLREYAKSKLKDKFRLKDFHFYLLAQGSSPLNFLQESIEKYVQCTLKNGKGEGCYDTLNPVTKGDASVSAHGVVDDMEWIDDPPEKPVREEFI